MAFTGNYATNTYKNGLNTGTFNLGTGTTQVFKIALYTNAASLDYQTTAYTTDGEVSATGYTAGGETLTISQVPTVGASGTTSYYSFSNVTWSGSFTARGALIYKAGDNGAVCVLDFGNDKTSTLSFTVTMPANTSSSALIRLV